MVVSIPFRILSEEEYLYEIPDGTILRIKYHLQRLTRTPLGTLEPKGEPLISYQVTSPSIGTVQSVSFPDPPCIKRGINSYVTGENRTIHVRPQVPEVVRTFDSRGIPVYGATVHWVADFERDKVMEAMIRPSTIKVTEGPRPAIVAAIAKEKTVLEWLFRTAFQDDWFSDKRNENHPAWIEWNICNKMIGWGGFKPDNVNLESMHLAAKVALDALLLVSLTEGDLGQMVPGNFQAIGDELAQKKVRDRIGTAQSFEDLFVELYVAAWHKTKGRRVVMLETEGFPDIQVNVSSLNFPILIECKRLTVNSAKRIGKDITKAIHQLRRGSVGTNASAYGAVVLDLTSAVGARHQIDDRIPDEINAALHEVEQALRGEKNTHVKSAIVAWDDYNVYGKFPESTSVLVSFRRRAKVIHHERNHQKLPIDLLFDGLGSRLMLRQVPDELR